VKLREIDRRRDKQCRHQVVQAMQREFFPMMDAPLEASAVLEFYENEATSPNYQDAYSLAALNAYLGRDHRALHWCRLFAGLVDKTGLEWDAQDSAERDCLVRLQAWIQNGEAKEHLERVLQEERRKWGLA
jgi:hypothetical protein